MAWLKPDCSQVIVARDARDYIWVMARTPTVSPADYEALMAKVKALGCPMEQRPQAATGRAGFPALNRVEPQPSRPAARARRRSW